jgi:diguanylate cyclase (GGDEF)-like protein
MGSAFPNARLRLRVRARFVLVLSLLVLGTGALGAFALSGLAYLRDSTDDLRDAVTQSTVDGDLRGDLTHFGSQLQAYIMSSSDRALRRKLQSEIEPNLLDVETGLAETRSAYRDDPVALAITRQQERAYRRMLAIWRGETLGLSAAADADSQRLTRRVHEQLDVIVAGGEAMQARDARAGDRAGAAADDRYRETRSLVIKALGALLLVSALLAVWLIRSVVPRARRYAQFARGVTSGELDARLHAGGADELDDLGRSLDALAASRQAAERYAETQTELNSALQVADSEEEAHLVLTAHLQRSIPSSSAVVLNRNNSADRLEARTPVQPGSALAQGLDGAGPRDCLAVRLARPQRRDGGAPEALMQCGVCGKVEGAVACDPLLVGGEVIGSVLVNTPTPIGDADDKRLLDTVVQAAPVLANLRNLAIAELRAATDSLTGLPNSRAVRDTVKRLAALAGRTAEPLAAAMLDLDHFKQINDSFGHERGDDVLAAVGAVLREQLRDSDFVGRLGGEEFVVLLPATDRDGAVAAAEKIRAAIAGLSIRGVDRQITISIGLAVIPEHAGDGDGLLRSADRALYAAKEHGRNRVEVAVPSEAAASRPSR